MKNLLPRHALFVAAAAISLVWVWTKGFGWPAEGGNLINLPGFFMDAYNSGNAAAFLTIDNLFVWAYSWSGSSPTPSASDWEPVPA